MTIKLPANVLSFAAGDTTLFDNFTDYWNQYRSEHGERKFSYRTTDKEGKPISFEEKEKAINGLLLKEISKRANFDINSVPLEQAVTHPMVAWAAANIVSQMIDAVLPSTMVEGTQAYAEIRTLGYGETGVFDIMFRDLFPVTKVGRGAAMREAEMHKGFERQVTLNPEGHEITVGVSLFRVLSGQESLAKFTTRAIRSLETELTKDIYNALVAGMAYLSTDATTGLQFTGYSQENLTKCAQRVQAYSGGAKAIVMGTKLALANVLPTTDTNYRYDLDSPYVTLGYVKTLAGVDTFEIPQIADWPTPFSTFISDSDLWVIAPSTDKLVKCVIGGATISNVTGTFDSAMLMQNATFIKNWKAGCVTSAVAGRITL
jgi:hypothetical protein